MPKEQSRQPSEDGETLLARFVGAEPTRSLEDWHALLSSDTGLPIKSHRGGLRARLIVACKRLLRPLVKAPQQDLWDRQRLFDLILIEELRKLADLRQEFDAANQRLRVLETCFEEGLRELARANDALYSRVDLKLERSLEATRRLQQDLRQTSETKAGTAAAEGAQAPGVAEATGSSSLSDAAYVQFEDRHRGSEQAIRDRVAGYVEELARHQPVLDLGCGRGELLSALEAAGVHARGVDSNAAMVRRCREDLGLEVQHGDLLQILSGTDQASLGAVTCLHVVEHLSRTAVDQLLIHANTALRRGGLLLLETPNPLSLVAGGRNFWLDATHLRPVHPEQLAAACRAAGFVDVGYEARHPFPDEDRLPEVVVPETLSPGAGESSSAALFHSLAQLRDALDDLLYGFQDYTLRATKP